MKKAMVFLFAFILTMGVKAQTVKQDANGNFIAVKTEATKEPAKNTGKTFTDTKGNVYPVFESKNGKLFYTRTSKAGNEYKIYIKVQ